MAHKGKKIKETALEAALEGLSLNGKSKGPGESNGPGAVGSPLRRQIKKLTRRAARAAKERIAYGTGNTPGASELPRLRKIKSLKRQEQNGVPPRITYETLRRQTQEAARLAREGIQSKEENQFFKNPISALY